MKLIQIFSIFFLMQGVFLYSQKNVSKVEEYLNEKKEGEDISITTKDIRNKKVPDASFSLEGRRGVDQSFISDEFVKSVIDGGFVKIANDGDMEFEPPKDKETVSESLKDDEEYTEEELKYWASVADQYYQFRDFDYYDDFYYYYDKEALENSKEKEDDENKTSYLDVKKYIVKAISYILPQVLILDVNYESALNYYGVKTGSSGGAKKVKYNVAKAAGANKSVLQEGLDYFNSHKNKFSNHRFMAVLEFSKFSAKSRFYIINLRTGEVNAAYHVSHGSGSDKDNDGYATYFSNLPGSKASSIGVYKTGEIYRGKYGTSLRLHGLSPTNSNVYKRAVVIHPSPYVKEANVKPGRSWGCMAFDYKVSGDVINMLRNGAFIYAKYR